MTEREAVVGVFLSQEKCKDTTKKELKDVQATFCHDSRAFFSPSLVHITFVRV